MTQMNYLMRYGSGGTARSILVFCGLPVLLIFFGCVLVDEASAQPEVPALTGRVVDLADILSSSAEASLTSLLEAHEDSTSNQVAVLTIPSLEGETIEAYALRVAETWALGTAEADNGVLLLVALSDREMRIEVGMGLEGDLTDAAAGRIIRNEMVPYFRSGDYEEGVLVGVERILGTIDGSYYPMDMTSEDDDALFWIGLVFLIAPCLFAFGGLAIGGFGRFGYLLFLTPFFVIGSFAMSGGILIGGIVLGIWAIVYLVTGLRGGFAKSNSSSGRSSSSSSWSSSSSSSYSSSSFSGGGGSFGGGGASGGW